MNVLAQLGPCSDVTMLRSRVADVSADYGGLERLDILPAVHEGRHQAICFMRLQTPEQEEALMRSLGVRRFGDEIAFTVDLQPSGVSDDSDLQSEWAGSQFF